MRLKQSIIKYFFPRVRDILFLGVFIAALVFGQRMLNLDGDLPRHLLTGRYILQQGMVPVTEPFAYPYAEKPYISHEWLADVILYGVFSSTGMVGLVLLMAMVLASTFTCIFSSLTSRIKHRLPIAFLVVWGAAVSSLNWAVRPHVFSMLLLAIWLIWCEDLAQGRKVPLWYFPLLMVVWSNLHGEFIAGILVLIAYAAGYTLDFFINRKDLPDHSVRKIWISLITAIIASLINPYGIQPWVTFIRFINNDYLMSRMAESNPPDFQNPSFYLLLGLLAFSILLLAINQKRISSGKGFLLAGFSVLSLIASRNSHLYGVVAPFVLSWTTIGSVPIPWFSKIEMGINNIETRFRGVVWPVLISLSFCLVFIFSPLGKGYHFSPSVFPVSAVKWLEENPQEGRMFNDLNWGGYLAFHLWPENLVFIDSMADTSGQLTQEYENVITMGDGWNDILLRYEIKWILLPCNSDFAKYLMGDDAWRILFQDQTSIILRTH